MIGLWPENKNSVAVMIGGNMIMMTEWKATTSAILMAFYPGMEGGRAGNIIFGDVNPSGKLPTVPYKEGICRRVGHYRAVLITITTRKAGGNIDLFFHTVSASLYLR